jgi:molybdenum cofactor synthesis domain-containing protein
VIELSEAKEFVLRELVALAPEMVALGDALGCCTATDVVAREQVPNFTNSSMDGFTLRAADTSSGSARLRIVDSILAGQVSSLRLGPGEAMRIMTGAPLPEGADTVCKIEEVTEEGSDFVMIPRQLDAGDCVRHPGDDVKVGQVLVSARSELTPTAIAVVAGQGMSLVAVHRRPVVGVLSTGDELARSTDELSKGQIRDLNRPLLLALLQSSGFRAVDLGTAADDYDEIARRLGDAVMRCDAVVSTGGVSVGDVDHVKNVISRLAGGRARSMQVAIKPAKPFAFGVVGPVKTPVFGLPGNPVSTRVSFELFVRPALRTLGGHRVIERLEVRAVLDIALPAPDDDKTHFVHVSAHIGEDGRVHVSSSARHKSHLMSAIVSSNAIAILVPGGSYEVGESARVMILSADALAQK